MWCLQQRNREAALQFYPYMYREEVAFEALAQAEAKMKSTQVELKLSRSADSAATVGVKEFLTASKHNRMLTVLRFAVPSVVIRSQRDFFLLHLDVLHACNEENYLC